MTASLPKTTASPCQCSLLLHTNCQDTQLPVVSTSRPHPTQDELNFLWPSLASHSVIPNLVISLLYYLLPWRPQSLRYALSLAAEPSWTIQVYSWWLTGDLWHCPYTTWLHRERGNIVLQGTGTFFGVQRLRSRPVQQDTIGRSLNLPKPQCSQVQNGSLH